MKIRRTAKFDALPSYRPDLVIESLLDRWGSLAPKEGTRVQEHADSFQDWYWSRPATLFDPVRWQGFCDGICEGMGRYGERDLARATLDRVTARIKNESRILGSYRRLWLEGVGPTPLAVLAQKRSMEIRYLDHRCDAYWTLEAARRWQRFCRPSVMRTEQDALAIYRTPNVTWLQVQEASRNPERLEAQRDLDWAANICLAPDAEDTIIVASHDRLRRPHLQQLLAAYHAPLNLLQYEDGFRDLRTHQHLLDVRHGEGP